MPPPQLLLVRVFHQSNRKPASTAGCFSHQEDTPAAPADHCSPWRSLDYDRKLKTQKRSSCLGRPSEKWWREMTIRAGGPLTWMISVGTGSLLRGKRTGIKKRWQEVENDSVANSTGCCPWGPRFNPQHPNGTLQLLVTLVPGDLTPSSGICRHQACTQCADIYVGKTLIHK